MFEAVEKIKEDNYVYKSCTMVKEKNENPIVSLRNKMDNLFDDFFKDFHELSPWSSEFKNSNFLPSIDVSENEKEIQINAELPGLTEKDIEVNLQDNVLILKGEKKQEEEKKDKNYHHIERRYGSFYRSIPINEEVDTDKIKANFKNGVLNILIPKNESIKNKKKIEIKTG